MSSALAEQPRLTPVASPTIPGLPSVEGLVRLFEEFQFPARPGGILQKQESWKQPGSYVLIGVCALGMLAAAKGDWHFAGLTDPQTPRPYHYTTDIALAYLIMQYPGVPDDTLCGIIVGFDSPRRNPALYAADVRLGVVYGQAVARATYVKDPTYAYGS